MCLPVFLASCHTLLILAGPTFLKRLWCIEEARKVKEVEVKILQT
jgi:hypothetical protein